MRYIDVEIYTHTHIYIYIIDIYVEQYVARCGNKLIGTGCNWKNVMCQESVEDAKKFGNETQLLAKVVQKLAVIRALAADLGHNWSGSAVG